jgi:hypothetical protein
MFEWGALWGNPDLGMANVNHPPLTPDIPSGITQGTPGVGYDYQCQTTDPDGDSIWYLFHWGEGTDSLWLGPYGSTDTCTASHSWVNPGIYHVKVKAKDLYDGESNWSDSLSVTIYTCADCNNDQIIDASDVVYLMNYLFLSGPAPDPIQAGDVNQDGLVDISDVIYLVNYLFIGGPPPCSS